MTSEKKREANRQNALRSTGPRTARGKARSARNATTHGLLSQEILVPGEDANVFERLRAGLYRDLAPTGTMETFLVERIAALMWKLRRADVIEADILGWRPAENPIGGIKIYKPGQEPERVLEIWLPDNGRGPEVTDPPEPLSQAAEKKPQPVGLAFLQGCGSSTDAFSKLLRYMMAFDKALYRAVHELERRQLARARRHVPAPVAVDVTVAAEEPGRADLVRRGDNGEEMSRNSIEQEIFGAE